MVNNRTASWERDDSKSLFLLKLSAILDLTRLPSLLIIEIGSQNDL
jgi:hypothetical protein